MSMIKIRKNAFLKIQTILAGSVGVICRSSSSRIDDGYDDEYRLSSCDEALTWLKENQERAQVYLETEKGFEGQWNENVRLWYNLLIIIQYTKVPFQGPFRML